MKKKIILITGASSGIGKASAIKLLKEGHIVYGASRRVGKMKELEDLGGQVLEMDVMKYETISKGIEKIIKDHDRIDVLFNNAGFGLYGPVETLSIEQAKYQFEVNLFGLARATQLVLPHMRKQGSGLIMNTSSAGGRIYSPLGAWYHASKHAVEGWSDCLRIELQQFGIHVVVIEPGLIDTEITSVLVGPMIESTRNNAYQDMADKIEAALSKLGPQKKLSPPSVIADIVAEAVNATKPKTRYLAGKRAKTSIFIRKWFGDRVFDRIIMSRIK